MYVESGSSPFHLRGSGRGGSILPALAWAAPPKPKTAGAGGGGEQGGETSSSGGAGTGVPTGGVVCKDHGRRGDSWGPGLIAAGGDASSLTHLFPAFPTTAGSAVPWTGRDGHAGSCGQPPTGPSSWQRRAVSSESPSSLGPPGVPRGSQRTRSVGSSRGLGEPGCLLWHGDCFGAAEPCCSKFQEYFLTS